MGRYDSTVSGESQTDGLVEAVHGIGGKHARTGTAGRACGMFYSAHLFVAYGFVGRFDHGID